MSLLDTLISRGVDVRRSQHDSNEISICCPFCSETRYRLGINIRKDIGHCFNCNWKSRHVTENLFLILGIEEADIPLDAPTMGEVESDVELRPPSLPEDFILLCERPKGKLFNKAYQYLHERGVTDWQIEDKKIGVSFLGQYAYRIIFPIYYKNKLKGLVSRDFTGQQEPKYLNTVGEKPIYNLPVKRRSKAVLVEGIFDCLAIERVVRENFDVLALLGNRLKDSQEEDLSEYRDIVLWPDADIAGVKGFLEIAQQLKLNHRMFIVPLAKEGKDAADMTKQQLLLQWGMRTRLTEAMELRLQAEVAFHE